MENSVKSRASFVDHKRKSLTFNNIFIDSSPEKHEVEKPKLSIESYLESLKKEKKDWKDLLREKKNKQKNYERQSKANVLTITEDDVKEFITSENDKFLKEKPDYLEMKESVRKYIDAVNYLNKYKADIIDYYGKAFNELEIDKKILVEEMCASNLCEICNEKNCEIQEHKFIN